MADILLCWVTGQLP